MDRKITRAIGTLSVITKLIFFFKLAVIKSNMCISFCWRIKIENFDLIFGDFPNADHQNGTVPTFVNQNATFTKINTYWRVQRLQLFL